MRGIISVIYDSIVDRSSGLAATLEIPNNPSLTPGGRGYAKVATETGRTTETALRSARMRSISWRVSAVRYVSPQCGQEWIGIPSMRRSAAPLP